MDRVDDDVELEASAPAGPARPRPVPPPLRRGWDATFGRARPWLDWFGAGRVAGVALTVAATVVGGWWLLRPAEPPTEAMLPYASAPSSTAGAPGAGATGTPPSTAAATVVVHVAGAVGAPGVYELAGGARVVDAVELAGGLGADADVAAVNLAAVLADGQRVYVAKVGETPPVVAVPDGAAPGSSVHAGPVDLNTATVSELDALPGIGPATASAIVAHRDEHGPFVTVGDLEAVRGIGPAKLAALQGLVTT